jgi:serine/threonine protein kinase
MGAVASSGEPTPEIDERINFASRQEMQCLKDHYESQIRMLQVTHQKEKRALKEDNKKMKYDNRVHKISNTKLRRNNATMMEAEADLQRQLQQVKCNMKKLEEDKDAEMIEKRLGREKRNLMEKIRELRDVGRSLKKRNYNLKKDCDERIKIQKEQQQKIQTLSVMNNDLQKKYDTVKGTEVKVQTDLERVKVANHNLNKYWESEMKDSEEKKKILVIRNRKLHKELDMTKNRHTRETRNLTEEISKLKDLVCSLKMTNNNLKKDRDERMEIQKQQQEEIQTLSAFNNELQETYDTVKETEVKVQTDLERLKVANDNLNKYWEWKMKDSEEKKKILEIRNRELENELESIKTKVSVQTSQCVGSSAQQGRQCGTDTADEEKVSLHNFQYLRTLGKGAFGTVFLATGELPGRSKELYAIKTLKKQRITSIGISGIMVERKALNLTFGNPFITTLYSCFQNENHLFFVMEYMSGGDLKEQLDKVDVFSEERTKFYTAEISLAVQFLHELGILHRDLKLENVLVGSDGHCKIADFGISKLGMYRRIKTRTLCGTPVCMAPEILKNLPYDQGVDWWAVGVMMFEMITGNPPFDYDEEEDNDDIAQEKLDKKIINDEVDFPKDMSPAAISIVMKLLMKDPAQRLGPDTVRQQSFFNGIDWKALQEKRVKPPEKVNKLTFTKVLKVPNTPVVMNKDLFEGFTHINCEVKRNIQEQVSE